MSTKLLKQMEGFTVALATPLTKSDQLDVAGLERLIARAVAGGAAGLFPLGWCGEQPALLDGMRRAVMVETCRLARGKAPVMVGISEQSLPRALVQAEMARTAGADLILATPPYSYQVPQRALVAYFRALAARAGLPLVVYQNAETGVTLSGAALHEISQIPGVVGVKSYLPYAEMQRAFLRSQRPGQFVVMNGDEYLYAAGLFLGIRHFTMGGPGNLCPGWLTHMQREAGKGNWAKVLARQKRLIAFCDALYGVDDVTGYVAIKVALEHLEICAARISSPHMPATKAQVQRIGRILKEYADVVAA